uniref:Multidrug resistance-associated protein 1-like n=1 Tax=Lepisosteus oculatus TaxID=7918 RepID=W5MTQ4_LEPOC
MTYWWFNRVIILGYKRPLQREDLFDLPENDSSYSVCSAFEKHWRAEAHRSDQIGEEEEENLKGKVPSRLSLLRALWQTFRTPLISIALLKVLADVLVFLSPQILRLIIAFCENQPLFDWNGPTYAVMLFAATASHTVILQVYHRNNMLTAAKIKAAVTGIVYRKALNLANVSRRRFTVGEVVNFMSMDAQQFMDLAQNLNLLWSGPFQVLLAVYFLWQELGPSVLAGVAVLLLVIPLNAVVASRVKHLKKTQMKTKDQRVKLLNEILHGIKILKLYSWEPFFQEKVGEIREGEIEVLRSSGYLTAFSMLTLTCVPFLVSLATFGVFLLVDDDNVLTASRVFTSITLFNILRLPLFDLPTVISVVVQMKVSLGRLETFLNSEELNPGNVQTSESGDLAVGFTNASFRWDKTEPVVLKDLNMRIVDGSLVAVVGQVGAGKSSFLSSILGELEKTRDFCNLRESVAYVSQQAWIQNATLQDNILFGCEMNRVHYELVLEACCLFADMEQLPDGDQTEIGERGVNLSGGQKQRVSLARAVYSDADIFLLDDPLSAVDVHVGQQLLNRVIGPTGLLKNKTRVLVTHNTTVLPLADQIVVMENGKITEIGSYQSLLSSKQKAAEFLQSYCHVPEGQRRHSPERKCQMEIMNVKLIFNKNETKPSIYPSDLSLFCKTSNFLFEGERGGGRAFLLSNRKLLDFTMHLHQTPAQCLMKKEVVATGNVKRSVIIKYLQSFGWFWVLLTVGAYMGQNLVSVGQNWLLSTWTTEAKQVQDQSEWKKLRDSRLFLYGLMGLIQALLVCSGAYVLTRGTLAASRKLHFQMLNSILHQSLQFFDMTPIGQVINRFTKDMYVIDERFHYYLRTWLNCMLDVLGTILIITAVTPAFLLVVVPLALIYLAVQRYYIASSRQIRRLDGASRSPIISHFTETVLGVTTIRAFGYQGRFINQNRQTINENLLCYYNNVISNRWLAMRLDFVGNLMVFFAALFMVQSRNNMDAATVGLVLSYALNVTATLNFWVRKACEIETNAVAIERVCEYEEMEKEAPWILPNRPPQKWPEQGIVQFVNYEARYRKDLQPTLRDVTFQTFMREKVGIVGRTGAGKSTLSSCLFRIIEGCKGMILIDEVDIASIGLHDLRGKLNIIPQTHCLLVCTMAFNIFVNSHFSDMTLWDILLLINIINYLFYLISCIKKDVQSRDTNYSVGQRQLVCLARALLRKSKLLVLDEATASIDIETDSLVQQTIRKEFADCTILTIAHRLHTIMDSDRVLVLDGGRVMEFDSPSSLIQQRGLFFHMATEAGIIHNNSKDS